MIAPPVSQADEAALSEAAMAGDRDAAVALWNRHRRWVAAVLLAYKPARADLEDLLQEVAMRLLSKVGSVRDEANLRAWLRTVAVNVCRSEGRRASVRRFEPHDLESVVDTRPDDGIGDHPVLRRLAQLPDAYREPLMLRAIAGMRTREIAEALELAPATVDTRVARARRMLREAEEDSEPCARGGSNHEP
jgi:RNA polymerase sigma-70 factor (ECF subfamily)